jgi:AcrR family transcriptional regulator
MQAAEALFGGQCAAMHLHEVTLDDIVRQARVGKGTVYTYFKDKEDLFFQVATRGLDELCELLVRRVSEEAPFTRQLSQVCEAITAFFRERRQLFSMIQTEDARMSALRGAPGGGKGGDSSGNMRARWFEKRKRLVQALARIVRGGQDKGLVRRDMPAEALAIFLLGMLRARARDLPSGDLQVRDEELVDLFLRGARKAPGKAVREVQRESRQ